MRLVDFARNTVARLGYLTHGFGAKDVGFLGLISDMVAECMRAGYLNSLPGHPEQALDALVRQASALGLYRFRYETQADFGTRIREHPTRAAQHGSAVMVLRAAEEYGRNTWPVEWAADTTTLDETGWATFVVTIDHATWSEDFWLDGVYDADLAAMAKELRKWAPRRSKGTLVFRTDTYEI